MAQKKKSPETIDPAVCIAEKTADVPTEETTKKKIEPNVVPGLREKLGPVDYELAKDFEFVDIYEAYGYQHKRIGFTAHIYWKSRKLDMRGFVVTALEKTRKIISITEPMALVWSRDDNRAIFVPVFSCLDPVFMDTIRWVILENCQQKIDEFHIYEELPTDVFRLVKSKVRADIEDPKVNILQKVTHKQRTAIEKARKEKAKAIAEAKANRKAGARSFSKARPQDGAVKDYRNVPQGTKPPYARKPMEQMSGPPPGFAYKQKKY